MYGEFKPVVQIYGFYMKIAIFAANKHIINYLSLIENNYG
jgi:hypothetical protein